MGGICRIVRSALLVLGGCNPGEETTSGLSVPSGPSVPMTSSAWESTSGASSTSTSTSTSTTGEGEGETSSAGPRWDMGGVPDLEAKPAGCQGKIDLLFVISRDGYMKPHQDKLVAALPRFIETIESAFVDFDVHILVTDSDPDWHSAYCENDCPEACAADPNYPCDYKPTGCDQTMGAGVVMNVGPYTEDRMCLVGPERYITGDDPDLLESFTCLARVGASGYNMVGDALVAGMSPQLNQPGGCNAGFLRDDALLMVTIISQEDPLGAPAGSGGTWKEWKQAVVDAKKGNLDAIVMFGLVSGDPLCLTTSSPNHRLCRLIPAFPHHVLDLLTIPEYGPAFDLAVAEALEACSLFTPS